MKTIGIKLADGSFYPILQENTVAEKKLDLTTAHNNQTIVMVDLYRSADCTMNDAEYVDSLQIENLVAHPNGEPDITFTVSLDENNQLSAKIVDTETGNQSKTTITLISRTQEERLITDEYDISDSKEKTDGDVKKVTGKGLLATAEALRDQETQNDTTEVEFTPAEDIELPDFSDFESPAIEESEETETPQDNSPEISTEETETFEDFNIPDEPEKTEEFEDFSIPDESETIFDDNSSETQNDTTSLPASDDDFDANFDLPDIPTEEEVTSENNELPDDFFNIDEEKTFSDTTPAAKEISFTGLYDKETELGQSSSSYEEDTVKEKTKVPVIICIICAIICLLATVLILFIIPSKYNLIKKTEKTETVIELQEAPAPVTVPSPEPEQEPVPEALEEEVVIVEKAEEVIPEQPPVAEEKPKDITYKIKWGDTLWDISETYYKNPWRYKYIARYNKIRNPDYIISGTYITIPAE